MEKLNFYLCCDPQDLRLLNSGKPARYTAEVERDLDKADGMIRLLFNDVQFLKDGRHLQSEQIYRRSVKSKGFSSFFFLHLYSEKLKLVFILEAFIVLFVEILFTLLLSLESNKLSFSIFLFGMGMSLPSTNINTCIHTFYLHS